MMAVDLRGLFVSQTAQHYRPVRVFCQQNEDKKTAYGTFWAIFLLYKPHKQAYNELYTLRERTRLDSGG